MTVSRRAVCWADVSDLTPIEVGRCYALQTIVDETGTSRTYAAYPARVAEAELEDWDE